MRDATKLREYTDRSNTIHREYQGDPELLQRYERFVAWQLDYMLPFYEDLRTSDDYAAAVDFVVSDLTGINVSERDHDIARVVPILSRMLPDKALRTVAAAMQLNARALAINLSICRELYKVIVIGAIISEREYCCACRRASQLDDYLELIQLTGEIGHSLDRVIRIPMIGPTLMAMRLPAGLAGFGSLQKFLERGHRTFSALQDVDQFLNDISCRMTAVFTRILTEPLEHLKQ